MKSMKQSVSSNIPKYHIKFIINTKQKKPLSIFINTTFQSYAIKKRQDYAWSVIIKFGITKNSYYLSV